ncbi:MAG: biotin/lipoyl-binding protein [Saprospiraceae bacterium]
MLNISPNSIKDKVKLEDFTCSERVGLTPANSMFLRWLWGVSIIILIIFFLPWTQNIQAKGKVTTLSPEHRPQTIHSTIAGRIEKWYVQEGQTVKKGDTIVYLSEIKAEYFDPQLVQRTRQQVSAKEGSIVSYQGKADALAGQIGALRSEQGYKTNQLRNKIIQAKAKITADSIEVQRAIIDFQIAQNQIKRFQEMYDKGLIPLVELESKNLKVQATQAKKIAADNKLIDSRNSLANARLALESVEYEYRQKIRKAQSDRFSTISDQFTAEGDVSKLEIQASNYEQRSTFYYILAPQDAYITKALTPGLGETLKEGDPVVSIMPINYELAVEIFVKPMDLPLMNLGQEVRFIFDGWPAIVFSGWPDASYGTFSGKVVAIDNMISENGKYRILVGPYESQKEWPIALRPGSGAQGIALLNDVPVWYEIWRELNGFPPDLYAESAEELPKLKAPIKSMK